MRLKSELVINGEMATGSNNTPEESPIHAGISQVARSRVAKARPSLGGLSGVSGAQVLSQNNSLKGAPSGIAELATVDYHDVVQYREHGAESPAEESVNRSLATSRKKSLIGRTKKKP